MSANYRNPNWLLPNELNQSINPSLSESRNSLYSMNFNGTDESIVVNNSSVTQFPRNEPYSVSFWINASTYILPSKGLMGNGNFANAVYAKTGYNSGFWSINWYMAGRAGWSDQLIVSTGNTLVANTWYHVCITYNGNALASGLKMYIDYSNVYNGTGALNYSDPVTNNNDWYIARNGPSGLYFPGKIDEVAIWNKALSATEVAALATANAPANLMALSAKPLAYWPLGEFAGNSGELGGTPSGQTNSWKFPNQAIKDYVFDFESGNTTFIKAFNVPVTTFTECTFSTWVNFESINGTYQYVMGMGSGPGNFMSISLWAGGSTWYTYDGSTSQTTSTGVSVGKWYNVVVTQTGTTRRFYINGVEDANSPFTVNALAIPYNNLTLGAYNNSSSANPSPTYKLDGQLSNTQIWNSKLTPSEIETLYNNGTPYIGTQPQSSNLQAWYKLNAATSSYNPATSTWTITDSAGSNNGTSTTLSSSSLIPSDLQFESPYSNFSLDFDSASNNMILLGAAPTLSSTLTISAWIKKSNLVSYPNYAGIFGTRNGTTLNMPYILSGYDTNSPKIRFRICQSNGVTKEVVSSNTQSSDVWYHIIGVADGSNVNLYINGVAETPVSYDGTIITPTDELVIGGQGTSAALANFDFDGKIDEAALWNTALTATQVNQVYNNGRPGDLTSLSPTSWSRLGEDAFFVNNNITIPNQISGGPTGTGSGTQTAMLSADAPQSYGGGYGVGLAVTDKIGDAPNSTANSLSYNMIPDNRHSYIPGYAPAKVDNAFSMSFDGINDYFDIGMKDFAATNGAISLWFNPSADTNSQSNKCLIGRNTSGKGNGDFAINVYATGLGNSFAFFIENSTTTTVCKANSSNFPAGSWVHIVVTWQDGVTDGLIMYINGVAQTVKDNGIALLAHPTKNISIANSEPSASLNFAGNIDEVAIFDYALTAKQIKEDIYNASTTGKTADLSNNSNLTAPVAWYRMGD